jgi:hypothetical protein
MRLRVVFVLGVAAVMCYARLWPQTPTARAWADSSVFFVGDPISVHVEITHSDALDISALVGDTLGSFHLLTRNPIEKLSKSVTTTTFVVATYDSGRAILPPLQFRYSRSDDSTLQTVETNPLLFTVRLVEVDTTKEIKDIKPPLSIPLTAAEISLIIGAIVGLALLIYAFYNYRKRKKEQKPEERYVPPPKQAHVMALEELALLKEKRLWQQGLIKPYYSEVTEIVRRYFENRFGFMSLEKTTDETMDDLRRFASAQSILEPTDRILRRADLVKFAKFQPSIPEHEEMLTVAFEIVEKTRVVEIASAPETAERTERREQLEASNV